MLQLDLMEMQQNTGFNNNCNEYYASEPPSPTSEDMFVGIGTKTSTSLKEDYMDDTESEDEMVPIPNQKNLEIVEICAEAPILNRDGDGIPNTESDRLFRVMHDTKIKKNEGLSYVYLAEVAQDHIYEALAKRVDLAAQYHRLHGSSITPNQHRVGIDVLALKGDRFARAEIRMVGACAICRFIDWGSEGRVAACDMYMMDDEFLDTPARVVPAWIDGTITQGATTTINIVGHDADDVMIATQIHGSTILQSTSSITTLMA